MTPALVVFPLLILVQSVLIIGLGMITATLNVFYSDIQQIVSVLIMLLFYMTPVFYSPKGIGESYRILYNLNPIAVLVESYRDIFFYGKIPDLGSLAVASVISAFLCGLGYLIYSRQLHNVIDAI
jgi:ABC-type polysaccharide/polyol phosphate export permease